MEDTAQRDKMARNGENSTPLEDYWKECNSFEDGTHTFEDDEDFSKTPDEGEAEEEWLREAGFHNLVDSDLSDPTQSERFADVLSTLTARQIAVVKRRLDTVQMSKKKRVPRSSKHRADVRELFGRSSVSSSGLLPTIHSEPTSLHFSLDGVGLSSSAPVERWTHKSTTPVIRSNDEPFSFHQTHHHSKSNSRALPLPFLRTSHSGGFSLREHTRAIDCESPTSVEVLRYETRNSVIQEDCDVISNMSDFTSICSLTSADSIPLETGYQEIASRINSVSDLTDDEKDLASLQRQSNVEVGELCENDRNSVRSLSIIEVAALLDTYGLVPTRRRKPNRKKGKDSVVFGASINALLELDRRRCPGLKVPLIYQWILNHLHSNGLREEGLLRLAGSVQKIQTLKTEIEKNYTTSPTLVENLIRQSSSIDISVLLKQLVRHLPEPLLTNSHMDTFLLVPNIPNLSDQMNILNLLILALPDGHRELLQELLHFLAKVVEEEEANRMSLTNVAMIMAPNLFPPPRLKKSNHKSNDLATEVTVAAMSSKVTQLLVKYENFLGSVPPELLAQARLQNHRTTNKNVGKRGGRKYKADKQKNAKDEIPSSVIRVQVPTLRHPNSLVVPVSDRTTARDVVENVADALVHMMDPRNHERVATSEQENRAFLQRPRTTSEPIIMRHRCFMGSKKADCLKDHFLYFIRENVGERRLDHGTNVLSVVGSTSGRFATGSTWEIRCHH